MARVKRGVTSHAKHKKVYKATKGHYGRRRNTIRIAKQSVEKATNTPTVTASGKKRTFRALWIQRINAAVRPFGLNYSKFIDGLAKAGIMVDRKVMSELAIMEPAAFQAIVEKAKAALPRRPDRTLSGLPPVLAPDCGRTRHGLFVSGPASGDEAGYVESRAQASPEAASRTMTRARSS